MSKQSTKKAEQDGDEIGFKLLNEDAFMPTVAYDGDIGIDVQSPVKVSIPPRSSRLIPLGLSIDIPSDTMALVQERSGHAHNSGVFTLGNVIDPSYEGEIHVCLYNTKDISFIIEKGDKIAQLIVVAVVVPTIIATGEKRGKKGQGSSDS